MASFHLDASVNGRLNNSDVAQVRGLNTTRHDLTRRKSKS
jgi:hypothetical protein